MSPCVWVIEHELREPGFALADHAHGFETNSVVPAVPLVLGKVGMTTLTLPLASVMQEKPSR